MGSQNRYISLVHTHFDELLALKKKYLVEYKQKRFLFFSFSVLIGHHKF